MGSKCARIVGRDIQALPFFDDYGHKRETPFTEPLDLFAAVLAIRQWRDQKGHPARSDGIVRAKALSSTGILHVLTGASNPDPLCWNPRDILAGRDAQVEREGMRDVSDGIETRSSLEYKVRLGRVYIRTEPNTPEPAWPGQAA